MRIASGIGIAWRSMSRNRLRTFFMMAGVMIGICCLQFWILSEKTLSGDDEAV